jgi:hypothetical protein
MKLSHRIRAYMLKRQANALLRPASRPHKQSAHMIGRTKFAAGPEALVSAAVAAALVAVVSLVLTEPVSPDFSAPVQVANQK